MTIVILDILDISLVINFANILNANFTIKMDIGRHNMGMFTIWILFLIGSVTGGLDILRVCKIYRRWGGASANDLIDDGVKIKDDMTLCSC